MTWHYRACRRKLMSGKIAWGVVEYYPKGEGFAKNYHTQDFETPWGDSKKELIQSLEWMLEDCKGRPVVRDEE